MGLRKYFKRYFEKHSAFFEGMGSLSIFPNSVRKPYWMKEGLTPQEQDYLAMKGDWEAVGNDLGCAMNNFKKSLANKLI